MSYELHTGKGTVSVTDAAIHGLVVAAAERVDGVRARRPRRGVEIALEGGRARVEIELAVRFGAVLPEAGRAVQESVRDALRRSLGVETEAVDVSVEELA